AGTDGLRVQPPAPALASRLWDSTSTADGARRAAHAGDGLILGVGPAESTQRPLADVYLAAHQAERRAAEQAEHLAERSDWGPGVVASAAASAAVSLTVPPARIAVAHGVFPGPDRHAAARDLAADIARYRGYLTHFGLPADADDLTTLDAMNVHHGPVETIIDSLATNAVGPRAVSTFIAAIQGEAGGAADFDATLRRLEVIATHIAPELGWRPASPVGVADPVGVAL
ncbi:LLM class flavin-dependent oxidoreductase, partial [Frankia sp. CNm7]|nr:LLM class flavin-dependent oxidoreductase [Frankia nepalensis]